MAENQSRVAIRGSEKRPVASAEFIGAAHPDERMEVTVHVRRRAAVAAAAMAGEHLSREAFAERFGADQGDLAKVERFARAQGFLDADVPYSSVVATQFSQLWT